MSKRKDRKAVLQTAEAKVLPLNSGLSRRGKKIITFAIIIVIIGFYILTKTNPQGDNWASNLSQLLIIAGYIGIAFGIIL
ncbi:MAG: hypothetical protein ABII74_05560 [Elusimicrobiota bacterium]